MYRGLADVWWLWRSEIRRGEPPDPAAVEAPFGIRRRVNIVGNAPGMLDVFAIHIDNVEGAVWRVDKIGRAKPIVRGSDHLRSFIHAVCVERRSVGRELEAIEEIACDFANKNVSSICFWIGSSAIHGDATR